MPESYVTKRRSPRRRLSRPAGFLHKGEFQVSEIAEIGEGGVMLLSDKSLQADERMVITFSIEGRELISVKGVVRYETDYPEKDTKGFGVQFENLDMKYRRYIRRFVSRKTEEEASKERLMSKETQTITYSHDDEGRAKPTVA